MKSVSPSSMVQYFLPPFSNCRHEDDQNQGASYTQKASLFKQRLNEGNSLGSPGSVWSSAGSTATGRSTERAAGCHESGTSCKKQLELKLQKEMHHRQSCSLWDHWQSYTEDVFYVNLPSKPNYMIFSTSLKLSSSIKPDRLDAVFSI